MNNIYDINYQSPLIERFELNNIKYVNISTNAIFSYFKVYILPGVAHTDDEVILWNGISVEQLSILQELNYNIISCSISRIDLYSIKGIHDNKLIIYLCFIDNDNCTNHILSDVIPLDYRDINTIPFTNLLNDYIAYKNLNILRSE